MPALISNTTVRNVAQPTVRRDAVRTFSVFKKVLKDEVGKLTYLALPNNGKMNSISFSSSTPNGVLDSTTKGQTGCIITGSAKLKITLGGAVDNTVVVYRSDVQQGQVFTLANGNGGTLYAHLGVQDRKYHSLPLHGNYDTNYAVTENGNSRVRIVGTFSFDVESTKVA